MHKIPDALRLPNADTVYIPCELADTRGRNTWKMLEDDYPEGQGMKLFSEGMKSKLSASLGSSLSPYLQGFDWGSLGTGTVVDVGGGNGHVEMGLVKKLSGLEFVVQDLPTNAEPAQALFDQHKAHDRVKFQPHDFFQSQPVQKPAPKAYMLSRVLHDWQDDDCVKILEPLLPAMGTHGTKLLVCERVLPDRDDGVFNYVEKQIRTIDMLMFTLFGGGERSLGEWTALFKRADPRLTVEKVERPLSSVFSFLTLGIKVSD